MKHSRGWVVALMLMASSCSLGLSVPALAQDTDAAALTKEFTGQSPAQTRTGDQLTTAYTTVLNSLLPDLSSTEIKKLSVAQETWERIALRASRPGAETERAAVSRLMLTTVGADAPQGVRVWMLKQLENVGRAEAVPTLVNLLNDNDPLIKERALRSLQSNSSAEAGQALRTALDGATAADRRIGFINALGFRRDTASVGAITRLLNDADANVASAAAAALGRIGGPAALQALTAFAPRAAAPVKPWVVDAQVRIAEQLLAQGQKAPAGAIYQRLYTPTESTHNRIAGLRGLVAVRGEQSVPLFSEALASNDAEMRNIAGTLTELVPGAVMTRSLATLLPKLPAAGATTLLGALGTRGDAAAKPAILQAMKSGDESVRIAALRALGSIGDASDIMLLARTAGTTTGTESDTARRTLASLRGAGVSDAMMRNVATAEPKLQVELIRGLAARRYTQSVPALIKSVSSTNESVSAESIKALGTLGDDTTVAPLVGVLTRTTSDTQRDALQQALRDIVDRSSNKAADATPLLAALPAAQGPSRVALITVLGRTGAPQALEAIRTASKDTNAEVQEAATRQLTGWPDVAAAPDLLELARTSNKPNYRVLALQGYVRLAGDRPAGEKLKMLQDSIDLARRPEDKRLVLGALATMNSLDAINLVQPFLSDNDVKEEASSAAVKIARNMGNTVDPKVQPVIEKVIATTKNADTTKQANEVLGKIKK